MSEERKSNPKFNLKDIKLFESVNITIKKPEPIATGETQYGTWNLWVAEVKDHNVIEGKKPNEKVVNNYSGEAIFFPPTKLHEKLVAACNGNQNVDVKITKTARETTRGVITEYTVDKLSEGTAMQSELLDTERKLIQDASKLVSEGFPINKEDFVKIAKENCANITDARINDLYNFVSSTG